MVEQCNLRPQLENKSLKETCRLDLQKIHEENARSIGGVFTSGQRMGTAFKVCPKEDDCVFVSANHVTQGEKNISIQMPDGTKGKATLLGRDTKSDLSILSVKGQEKNTPQSPGAKLLPPLELVSKGDPVVGIGHADGRKIKSLSPGEIKTPDTPLGKGIRRDLATSG